MIILVTSKHGRHGSHMGLQNIEFYLEKIILPLISVYQLLKLKTRSKNTGGNSHNKDGKALTGILKRTLKPGIEILFCGSSLNFFSPVRGTNSKTTH